MGRQGRDREKIMKIAVDTNVLVRAAVRDDLKQADIAAKLLRNAEMIAVAVPCLCEFVWVLRRVYGFQPSAAADAIRTLLAAGNVEMNRPAVEAGLSMLDAGGDFADGVIAYEGRWLGAEVFVSFDKKAVETLRAEGEAVRLL
jgi:predicted nucleic-acid-binding protein